MRLNIAEFVAQAGLDEGFYPGKRVVKLCPQPGEFKSHCVVYDWRNPDKIMIEIMAGLTGHILPKQDLVKYPVSFQTPTFIEIDIATGKVTERRRFIDGESDEGETEEGRRGSSDSRRLTSFSRAVAGAVPNVGDIAKIIVMGMQVAANAYAAVLTSFTQQAARGKIIASDMLAHAGQLITKFTPPTFLKPTGNETAVYKYDRSRNEPMFGMGLT
ncbi:MAG: hypothetical protein V4621_00945 [Pseudomonadota bacterium]